MEQIITTPQAGWSSLDLPEYHAPLSYIDDIPMMFCHLSEMDTDQFCKQVIQDLCKDITHWVNTYYDQQEEPKEWKGYYYNLKENINKCQKLFQ